MKISDSLIGAYTGAITWSNESYSFDRTPNEEQALLLKLLTKYRDRLPNTPTPDSFIRSFRATDVCDTGAEDFIMFGLMNYEPIFMKVLGNVCSGLEGMLNKD